MPALVSNAGSRGTGSPSLPLVAQVVNLCVFTVRTLPGQPLAVPPVAQVVNLCVFTVRTGIGVVKADRP